MGEILIERGLVTPEQLSEALKAQSSVATPEYIGEILVRLGYVAEIDIVIALVLQCNLPFIAVSKHEVDPEVLKLIPVAIARRDRIVPLDRIGNILSVVMQNPLNDELRDEVEQMTGCRIATFISTKAEIENALARFYKEEA
jgi:hypothetical protein